MTLATVIESTSVLDTISNQSSSFAPQKDSSPSDFPTKFLNKILMQPFGSQSQTSSSSPMSHDVTGRYPGSQTLQQVSGQMQGGLERMREWLQNWIQNTADTLRVYVNQYPPLAAFLFTLLVLSALPVSAYVIFNLITSGIFLTIAFIGFAIVQGFILLSTGGVLLAILGTIALFTTMGFAMISAIYLSYRGGCYVAGNLWQAGGQIGSQMKEAAHRVGQSMQHPSMGGAGAQAPYSSAPGGYAPGAASGTSS